jgi:hypothetical protein
VLVPLAPKELTDTLRKPSVGHGVGVVGTLIFSFIASIAGFNLWKLALGGMTPVSRIRTALMTDARPLAPSVWPMFDLTDPLPIISFYLT